MLHGAERPQSSEYITDSYRKIISKNNARANREEITKRVYLENLCQKNFPGKDWKSFFQNVENKPALIDLFSKYLVRKCFPEVTKIPIAFTNERNTFQVS